MDSNKAGCTNSATCFFISIPYYIYVRVMRGENLVSNTKLVDFALNTVLTSSPIRAPHGINFVYASCDLLLNLR